MGWNFESAPEPPRGFAPATGLALEGCAAAWHPHGRNGRSSLASDTIEVNVFLSVQNTAARMRLMLADLVWLQMGRFVARHLDAPSSKPQDHTTGSPASAQGLRKIPRQLSTLLWGFGIFTMTPGSDRLKKNSLYLLRLSGLICMSSII